jgi:hypothetical protein
VRSAISLTLLVCLLGGAPSASAAEEHGHFFFFVAPGGATSDARAVLPRAQVPANATLVHVGGGGEGALGNAWGIGTDVGGLARTRGVSAVTAISVNSVFHLLGQHHPSVDPYLTTGYGWLLGGRADPALGLPNLGGGMNYWLAEHHRYNLGFKLEYRGYLRVGQDSVTYREVRVGVTLWQ